MENTPHAFLLQSHILLENSYHQKRPAALLKSTPSISLRVGHALYLPKFQLVGQCGMGKAEFPFGPVFLEAWELNSTSDFESLRPAIGLQSSHIPHLPVIQEAWLLREKYAKIAHKGRLWIQDELLWINRLKAWMSVEQNSQKEEYDAVPLVRESLCPLPVLLEILLLSCKRIWFQNRLR